MFLYTRTHTLTHTHGLLSPYHGIELPCTPGDSGSSPRQKSETRERVSGANMCRCSACVLMNSTMHFHIIIQQRTLSLSPSSIAARPTNPPPPLTHPPIPFEKSLLSHYCGNWWRSGPGLGGRVGKTLQTRREQMPET